MARPVSSADVFRAVGDPTRRRIIELLHERARSAGEIAASFSSCQSTVSEHLAILRRAGLVTYAEVEGRRIYELTPAPLAELADWASTYSPAA